MAAVAGTEESGSKRAKQRVSLEEALDLLITDETVSGRLIRSLIPSTVIPEDAIINAVSSMCTNALSTALQCPFVCHLLYLLTRKQDVTAFRVRALLQLQRKMGPQPHLMGLLSLCKLFCPQMVAIVIPKSRRNFFKRIDKAWLAKVKVVQDRQRPEAFLSNNNDSHYSPSDVQFCDYIISNI
ncbi:hypothetical protein CAPTEDRAFT_206810 [Capitella teleta]|uniref:Uncharacterized protein n=1 Tax=Capitella teleta TaxID=283909 RepID=R7TC11_CAPTE|nr:hypothetical protein CAPTEDRAFT_206810 [Capitella teleta]|eukprot:ELT91244.1 hypothetical protein CAPTEDRAFT_206810 [Capitella teleta]